MDLKEQRVRDLIIWMSAGAVMGCVLILLALMAWLFVKTNVGG